MSNIEKIQKMVKGIYNRPIQKGYEGKTVQQRKEGEEWTDARGRSWKIEDGKRKQITKIPPRGFDMETKRWEAVLAEYESEMNGIEDADSPFDKTIANAIANHEHRK